MSNEIVIKESDSIQELTKLKYKAKAIEEGLKSRGVSCSGYIAKLNAAIDKQIAKEMIQALEDEVKKLKKGEATLFETKTDEVVEKENQ